MVLLLTAMYASLLFLVRYLVINNHILSKRDLEEKELDLL